MIHCTFKLYQLYLDVYVMYKGIVFLKTEQCTSFITSNQCFCVGLSWGLGGGGVCVCVGRGWVGGWGGCVGVCGCVCVGRFVTSFRGSH